MADVRNNKKMADVRNNENEALKKTSEARSTARRRSPMGTDSALPLYHLGFVSLDREAQIDSLRVSGDVPPWLNGRFDGLAMLHRFTLADGQVSYANRSFEVTPSAKP